jgi:hypothetical protein
MADKSRPTVDGLHKWLKNRESFQQNIGYLHALYFQEMERRRDVVTAPHTETFNWISILALRTPIFIHKVSKTGCDWMTLRTMYSG